MRRELLGDDHLDVAVSKKNLASALRMQGRLSEAAPLVVESLARIRFLNGNEHIDTGHAIVSTAMFLELRGDLIGAEKHFREGAALYAKILGPQDRNTLHATVAHASVLSKLGEYAESEALFRQALPGLRALPSQDRLEFVRALNNLGLLLMDRGNAAAAVPLAEEALAIYREVYGKDHRFTAAACNNLGKSLLENDNLERAEAFFRESLAMHERVGVTTGNERISILNNLAQALHQQERISEAEEFFQAALDDRIRTAGVESPQAGNCMINLARLLQRAGKLESAEKLYRDALVIFEKSYSSRHPRLTRARFALATLLESKGDFGAAQALYRQALDSAEQQRTEILGNEFDRASFAEVLHLDEISATFANFLIRQGNHEEAFQIRERGRGRAFLDLLARSELDWDSILEQANDPALTRARNDAAQTRIALVESEAQFRATQNRKDVSAEERETLTKEWREIVSTHRRELEDHEASVLSGLRDYWPESRPLSAREVIATLNPQDSILVWNWSSSGVGVILLRSSPIPVTRGWILANGYQETRELRDQIVSITSAISCQVGKGRAESTRAEQDIANRLLPSELRRELQSAGRIIVSPDGPLFELPFEYLWSLSGERGTGRLLPVAYAESVAVYVNRAKRRESQPILVQTEKPAALLVGNLQYDLTPDSIQLAQGSIRGAANEEPPNTPKGLQSSLDHIRFFGGRLEPLPASQREIEQIAQLLRDDWQVTTLTGPEATCIRLQDAVKGKHYLHLATHGFSGSRDRPYDAALALAMPASDHEQAFLSMQDLVRSWRGRLSDCELVVLSACDTCRAVRRGDSAMCLPWGFMYAGAPSVVASLWRTDDFATSLLMKRFVENWLGNYSDSRQGVSSGKRMSKASALLEAKIWLRGLVAPTVQELRQRGGISDQSVLVSPASTTLSFSDPYYWAGFILLGDPD